MMKQLYTACGGFAHWLASPLLRLYFNAHMVRVRTLVINDQNEILLTRSWFGHQKWSLPGGGVHVNEQHDYAAARETAEETGVQLTAPQLQRLGRFANADSAAPFTIDCFFAHITKQQPHRHGLQRLEILDVQWFALTQLPQVRSATVDKALELYKALK